MICTRCKGSGFLNLDQMPEKELVEFGDDPQKIVLWIKRQTSPHDVSVCDCCGDGEQWHGEAGYHYSVSDPKGSRGPYKYNGGLCECN